MFEVGYGVMSGSRPLTEPEISLMLSHTTNPMHRALICLGVRTGYRVSELICITVQDVFDGTQIRDSITVRRSNMKGKKSSRSVVLHEQAKQALRDYLSGYNLTNTDETTGHSLLFPISRFAAHRLLKKYSKLAGLEGRISTHSMRKHFAMRVYEKTGKDVVCVQRALGHASLASTTKYLSVGQDVIDSAIMSD
jgi:site-specific recombinase XerD